MQIEGTETPTALTPNSTGDSNTKAASSEHIIDTTPGNNQVDFPAVLVQGFSPSQSESNSTNQPTNDTANTAKPTPLDTKQVAPENSSPATQTQRSETTSPNTQDTSGHSSSSSSPTTQNNRGNSVAPQVQTNTPSPTFTSFDSSSAGAPKSTLTSTIQSNQPEGQNQKTQSERANYESPDWFSDPFSPHNPALKNYQFNDETPLTLPTATKVKKKKPKKKGEAKKRTPLVIDIPSKQKSIPKEDEETAKEEAEKVMMKLNDFNRHNLGKPIPLSPEDLEAIMLYEFLLLRKKNTLLVFRANTDGYFFIDLSREYMITKQIGDIPPGIYGSSDINYYYQGLVSATDGRTSFGDSEVIGGYNVAQGLPGFFTGNIDSIEHNFNQAEIGPAFSKIGFYFAMNYNNTHE